MWTDLTDYPSWISCLAKHVFLPLFFYHFTLIVLFHSNTLPAPFRRARVSGSWLTYRSTSCDLHDTALFKRGCASASASTGRRRIGRRCSTCCHRKILAISSTVSLISKKVANPPGSCHVRVTWNPLFAHLLVMVSSN